MKKLLLPLLFALLPTLLLSRDNFDGAVNTGLEVHDAKYESARSTGGYDVEDAELDGAGHVRSENETNGGWCYVNSQPMDGQTSELRVLAYGPSDGHDDPYVRILVATRSDETEYYGWEPTADNGTHYTEITWFRGAQTIVGMDDIDISGHNFLLQADHTFKSVLTYNSSSELKVEAYIDDILIDTLYVEDVGGGQAVESWGGTVLDTDLPFYSNTTDTRYPGMLWHSLGTIDTRALFDWWDDGVSFASPGPSLTVTSLTIGP